MSKFIPVSNQYVYTGRGPVDAKARVEKFSDLLEETTWSVTGNQPGDEAVITCYNGMIVTVYNDGEKNGIYVLFDENATDDFTAPNYQVAENWSLISNLDGAIEADMDFGEITETEPSKD